MTALDGDPLTGDPGAADVRHLLRIICRAPRFDGVGWRPDEPCDTSLHLAPGESLAQCPECGAEHSPRPTPRPIPAIHEACGLGQCAGCSSKGCVSRKNAINPVPVEAPRVLSPEQPFTRAPWYDTDSHIDGNGS